MGSLRAAKSMLVSPPHIRRIVDREFVLQSQTVSVNDQFCCNILKRLKKEIWHKLPELSPDGNLTRHHDSAPDHSALKMRGFFFGRTSTIASPTPTRRIWLPTGSSFQS